MLPPVSVNEAQAFGLGSGSEIGVVAGNIGEGLESSKWVELLEFEPSARGDDEGTAGEEGAGSGEGVEQLSKRQMPPHFHATGGR